jgi:hypothetical protein
MVRFSCYDGVLKSRRYSEEEDMFRLLLVVLFAAVASGCASDRDAAQRQLDSAFVIEAAPEAPRNSGGVSVSGAGRVMNCVAGTVVGNAVSLATKGSIRPFLTGCK